MDSGQHPIKPIETNNSFKLLYNADIIIINVLIYIKIITLINITLNAHINIFYSHTFEIEIEACVKIGIS